MYLCNYSQQIGLIAVKVIICRPFPCIFVCVCVDETELKDCLLVLVDDQQKLSAQMAKSTLSAQRLRQRLVILERYLISLSHSMMEEKYKVRWKTPPSPPLPAADNKR